MSIVVGVDVGGTFTDLILVDEASGALRMAKVPTSIDNQAEGVMAALASAGARLAEVDALVHGTTTTTNAMLERKVARTGLITTRGFRDVLELGRRTRPTSYGLTGTFRPLIERELRIEVTERMDAAGQVVRPLDEAAVAAAARTLLEQGVESVVIHFLHSYINPAHEQRAGAIVRGLWPNRFVTEGHRIISEYREYERGVTATVNACVQPVLARYIGRLQGELNASGFDRELLVMQGNGGTVAASIVAEAAVNTVMSGPASGVIAAAFTASAAGFPNVVTYDMGGTSSDVALIQGGLPQISTELELEYAMPIHVPMVDVHSIGAGGGSLAFINDAGMLQVGPQSAGARPGPICYGRGGTQPTITDANLALGRLDAGKLLSVDTAVSLAYIHERLIEVIGKPLGQRADEAAAAIVRIANDRMAGAIRMVSLARGYDPRDFALFAFGGAGPLHACALARELGIPIVLIPMRPGLTNALGCAVADVRHDFIQAINRPLVEVDDALIARTFGAHRSAGEATIARERAHVEALAHSYRADMQFQGQSHVLSVSVPSATVTVAQLYALFEQAYFQRFQVDLKEIRPVLVNLHTAVFGKRRAISLAALVSGQTGATVAAARVAIRKVWFESGWLDTPVYAREALPVGGRFTGPAIVEQLDATSVIEPGNEVEVDRFGNLLVRIGATVKGET